MNNPIVTVFCSSIRSKLWPRYYQQFTQNKLPWEVILVGDVKSSVQFPDNFKHIYSTVKPAQCFHIAVQNARGKYIVNMSDDSIIAPPRALDIMVKELEKRDITNTIISATHAYPGHVSKNRFMPKNPRSPVSPTCSMMTKELWNELGGIDVRFIGLVWDLDMAFNLQSRGGNVVVLPVVTTDDKSLDTAKGRFCSRPEGKLDFLLLYRLWLNQKPEETSVEQAEIRKTRRDPVRSYVDDPDILTISQGPSGKWL